MISMASFLAGLSFCGLKLLSYRNGPIGLDFVDFFHLVFVISQMPLNGMVYVLTLVFQMPCEDRCFFTPKHLLRFGV